MINNFKHSLANILNSFTSLFTLHLLQNYLHSVIKLSVLVFSYPGYQAILEYHLLKGRYHYSLLFTNFNWALAWVLFPQRQSLNHRSGFKWFILRYSQVEEWREEREEERKRERGVGIGREKRGRGRGTNAGNVNEQITTAATEAQFHWHLREAV